MSLATPPGDPGFRSLDELEEIAAGRLPAPIWAYVQGGAGEERTLRANRSAFARATVRPRVLRGVGEIDLRVRLLDSPCAAPLFVCPTAYQAKIHPDAESGVARAAATEGVVTVVSTLSSHSIETIAAAAGAGSRWFQLYPQPDRAVERRLLDRAEAAGYSALVVTVDTPVLGVRDRQARGGFAIDGSVPIGNGSDVVPPSRGPILDGVTYRLRPDAGATWELVDRLREQTRLPIVVKGILTPEDARECVDHGAKAIIVSNHGGRQLDGAPATLDVLPDLVAAVGGHAEVYLDGGVRRGTDVIVALARGAKAVGIGRPILWALAAGGEPGVRQYLAMLKLEVVVAMALLGRRSVAELDRTVVGDRSEPPI